ncbi:hypothetical protein ACFSL6_05745 [Paenibacillus thailandensis]|uniref:Transposase n=1 Tax=Paenibacillus thailandensis TaxID=393250 RepID=A0ABW5QT02_9BACL
MPYRNVYADSFCGLHRLRFLPDETVRSKSGVRSGKSVAASGKPVKRRIVTDSSAAFKQSAGKTIRRSKRGIEPRCKEAGAIRPRPLRQRFRLYAFGRRLDEAS